MDASLLGGSFEFVSYQEVDAGQREEFETLLRKVGVVYSMTIATSSGWQRSSLIARRTLIADRM